MPDRRNYTIATRTNANVSLPRRTLTYAVHDSETGAFIASRSIRFPEDLATLTAEKRDELIGIVLEFLARERDSA